MSVALLRMIARSVVVSVLAVGLWLGAAGRAQADPLNPLDFTSLGAFPTGPGFYTINTSGTPTLSGPNGTSLPGVVSHGVAVFDFDSINVPGPGPGPGPPFQVFTATGSLPLALLSRTNATIAGTIDGSGQSFSSGGPGGPGGGNGPVLPFTPGGGPGGGGPGGTPPPVVVPFVGGGGGGFGGPGGAGASSLSNVPGGLGGVPYGDLARQLQGGSGGGTSFGPGAGGGGAIEIGAVGSLAISGSILARGGSSISSPEGALGGGGGGSGGGILLHANSVLLTGSLSAVGALVAQPASRTAPVVFSSMPVAGAAAAG